MDENNHLSCATHCCKNHGCKYGYDDCPVSTGKVAQEYLCEYCTYPLEEADHFVFNTAATTLTVGYAREDGTLTDLPDEAAVDEAVRAALTNLEVAPGWRITVVLF